MTPHLLTPAQQAVLDAPLVVPPALTYTWWMWLPALLELLAYAFILAIALPWLLGALVMSVKLVRRVDWRLFGGVKP
jgi:hypothetical protein